MKHKIRQFRFRKDTEFLLEKINYALEAYTQLGYRLSLGQLYYRLVDARIIQNDKASYDKLNFAVNRGRLAGLVDWNHITDRFYNYYSFTDRHGYSITDGNDWWKYQEYRPELWVEKESLLETVAKAAKEYRIPFLCTYGFMATSELWKASQRMKADNRIPLVFFCGDHDPSGMDMLRDIEHRLYWCGVTAYVERVALTTKQIEESQFPSNPVTETDTRYKDYMQQFGNETWEIESVPPQLLVSFIKSSVESKLDMAGFDDAKDENLVDSH